MKKIGEIATVLVLKKKLIRFQSNINFKIFSLAPGDDCAFDFVELCADIPEPVRDDMRTIYQGNDHEHLIDVIIQEVTRTS